nr:SPOCS domain-containing protein [Caldicoprobacter algeriensis]
MSQALVEGDVVVPEAKPDIARVLDVDGTVVVNSKEVVQDRVMVEGVVRCTVLYVGQSDSQLIESLETEIGFTHYLDMPGAKPNMLSTLKCQVEHVEYEVINSRKLNIKTVVNLQGRVNDAIQLEVIQNFKDMPNVQMLKDKIVVSRSQGQGSSQAIVREDLELEEGMPSIQKILKKNASVKVNDRKVMDNRVVIEGDIKIQLLYVCDEPNEPLQHVSYDMPFSHSVDIVGAYQGLECAADVWVQELFVEPREDINGEMRVLNVEAVIAAEARVFETETKELLIDAYCPGLSIQPKKRKIKLTQVVGEAQDQVVVKDSMTFPENVPQAARVFYVEAKPIITDQHISDGKVVIEGVLVSKVIYQSTDPSYGPASIKEDIPFRQSVGVEGAQEDMECQSQLVIDHVNCTLIAPDEVEFRAVMTAEVSVFTSVEKEVFLDVEVEELKQGEESGIFVYFVQPGDSLWSIAKKYNTTIASILKYNAIDESQVLTPGDKLLIYKKLEVLL